ncbi:GNAT family N-acetyltransferase [Nocardioides hankookensis]|uniref:GNAT family N-acetyltransferase n=1 Tax=Nocardioides hankookensis TaxID=443157 RepID=A0ABW1LLF8_9ACTN
MADVETSHNPAEHRYEAHLDGELAGFAAYDLTDRLVIFTHTEVDPKFEGHGVGSALARYALDDVRATGTHEVLALCPFIKSWIGKHPEYEDLLHR